MQNYTKEIKAIMNEYTLFDNDFMEIFFDSNTEAIELVLNIILGRDDLMVKSMQIQKEETSPEVQGRCVIFDIYAVDHDGKNYDIEIQKANVGAIPQRARYYSGVLDSRMLNKGQSYQELKDSYVIFITENDVMEGNQPLYHIERKIEEKNQNFNDGNHIIYVNGSYRNDQTEIGKLMHDFRTSQASELYYEVLKKGMEHYKGNQGDEVKMTKAEKMLEEFGERRKQEGWNEGISQGKAEGKAEGNLEGAIKLGKTMGLSDDMIISQLIKMFQVDQETARKALKAI